MELSHSSTLGRVGKKSVDFSSTAAASTVNEKKMLKNGCNSKPKRTLTLAPHTENISWCSNEFFSYRFSSLFFSRLAQQPQQPASTMSQPGNYPTTNSSSTNNANSMPIAAENYQLKWNSHVTNLNSSISSLYKNDKYADCMLFTCNVDEGCFNFAAHKLILATCSHYFASLFDSNPMPINGMIFIVLPPELSRRSMGILLEYMYVGEATVSNDILNEVLKGGEVLKIRGLCKVQSDTPTFVASTSSNSNSSNFAHQTIHPPTTSSARASPMRSNKSTPRNSIDRKSSVEMKSHIPASYVLTQQQQPTRDSSPPPAPPSASQQSTTIIVKKTADVTIDPADSGNIPVEHYGLMSLKIAAAVKKAQQQNSHNISSMKKTAAEQQHHQNREFYSTILSDREPPTSVQQFDSPPPPPYKIYTSANDSNLEQQIQEDILRYTEKKKRIENPTSGQSQQFHDEREHQRFPEALSFVSIKEEPLEWPEMAQIDSKSELVDINVKPECIDESQHHHQQPASSFSPLTCETCNLKFQVPSAWVRHIESHSEANNSSSSSSSCSGNSALPSVPKKRKRTTDEVSFCCCARYCC